nr:hypothetical protein [Tanacetum cinerariifolium]
MISYVFARFHKFSSVSTLFLLFSSAFAHFLSFLHFFVRIWTFSYAFVRICAFSSAFACFRHLSCVSPAFARFRQLSRVFVFFRAFTPAFARLRPLSRVYASVRDFAPAFARFGQRSRVSASVRVFGQRPRVSPIVRTFRPAFERFGQLSWVSVRFRAFSHAFAGFRPFSQRKRVGPLPTYHLAVRHSVDYSSSDHFTSDDLLIDSPSDLLSETSSDSSSDALSDSLSGHSSSNHSSPALPSSMRSCHQLCSSVPSIPHSSASIIERPSYFSFVGHPRKRSRSPATSIPLSLPIHRALYYVRANVLPPRKRIRSFDIVTDIESWGIDARVVVETIGREEVETSARGTIEVRDDRVMHQRISELERDNMRLRGMLDLAKALKARNAARNLEPLAKGGDEQEDENGDNYESGNGGGNGNRNGNGNRGVNGNGNDNGKGGVNVNENGGENGNGNGNGNGRGNGYGNHNVNFGVLNSALTWWNSHKRTIRVDAAYAMKWTELMKLTTEVRLKELVFLCTRMVPDKEDKFERFIGGLPDNIHGNMIAAEPTRLQDVIRIANNLIDQKLKGYTRRAKNNRRFNNNPRDNRRQQPAFKRQNVRGQNVARGYTAKNNEKKRVGHMARDCTTAIAPNTQRALVRN